MMIIRNVSLATQDHRCLVGTGAVGWHWGLELALGAGTGAGGWLGPGGWN